MWFLHFLLHKVQGTIRIWFTLCSLMSQNRWALKSNLKAGTVIQFWVTRLYTTAKTTHAAPCCHLNLFWKWAGDQTIFFSDNDIHIPSRWFFFRGALASPSWERFIQERGWMGGHCHSWNSSPSPQPRSWWSGTRHCVKEILAHLNSICTYQSVGQD